MILIIFSYFKFILKLFIKKKWSEFLFFYTCQTIRQKNNIFIFSFLTITISNAHIAFFSSV
ncbi:hypothetical protein B566_EDAN018217, partial [Ephemera danica]